MKEIWKRIDGSDVLEVSNLGRIRCLDGLRGGQQRKGTVYSPFLAKNGYLTIAPKFGASRKKLTVHRLVAAAFAPGFFEGASVNHKDGCKTNNRADNLEWITLAENTRHQWRTGLIDLRGEKHPSAKLTNADVAAIRTRLIGGERITALANEFGVSAALIYKIKRGTKRR